MRPGQGSQELALDIGCGSPAPTAAFKPCLLLGHALRFWPSLGSLLLPPACSAATPSYRRSPTKIFTCVWRRWRRCGPGNVTVELAKTYVQVVGVDPSKDQLDHAIQVLQIPLHLAVACCCCVWPALLRRAPGPLLLCLPLISGICACLATMF